MLLGTSSLCVTLSINYENLMKSKEGAGSWGPPLSRVLLRTRRFAGTEGNELNIILISNILRFLGSEETLVWASICYYIIDSSSRR